jgi:hypothetical protein
MPSGLSLGVRAAGDWTEALSRYASETVKTLEDAAVEPSAEIVEKRVSSLEGSQLPPFEVPVQVLIDGPYGGSSVDLGDYETVLLLSGGSGITFTLGLLDDIVGRCVRMGRRNGEKTRRIEFVWYIRSFGECQLCKFTYNILDIYASI